LGKNVEVEAVKRNGMHKFEVIPKRWVVERSFGWLASAAGFGETASGKSTIQLAERMLCM
jgi:transposase